MYRSRLGSQRMDSNKKNGILTYLDYDDISQRYEHRYERNRYDTEPMMQQLGTPMSENSEPGDSFDSSFRLTLRVLQLFGFYPNPLPRLRSANFRSESASSQKSELILAVLLKAYVMGLMAINAWTFWQFVQLIQLCQRVFNHWLHALFVAAIMMSAKPIINIVNYILIGFRMSSHSGFLQKEKEVYASFSTHFGPLRPQFTRLHAYMIGSIVISFSTIFGFAIAAFILMQRNLGNLQDDIGLVTAPLLTVWNLIPLVYFHQYHILMRALIAQLRDAIRRNFNTSEDNVNRRHSMRFFYQRFTQLADLQMLAGEFFNPYVGFSFFWALATLCLTIYFIVNAGDSFTYSPFAGKGTAEQESKWQKVVYINFTWIAIQILLSFTHILSMCNAGRQTNEETRTILNASLKVMADQELSASDHVYISCFSYRLQLQATWGATVWRAFPLERGAFLQLTTLVMSYAMILLKFRGEYKSGATDSSTLSTSTMMSYLSTEMDNATLFTTET